ncbi:SRPBCC family protein [Lacunimicrobium album]
MSATPISAATDDQIRTIRVHKETFIAAPIDIAYECILDELGPENQLPGKPMPMILEPFPGGRWFRDLGNDAGHFWGHVQVIKPPTLIEITGPLFMSYAGSNHLQYKLRAEGEGTWLTFLHTGFGLISEDHLQGVHEGWQQSLNRIIELAKKRIVT